MIDDRHEFSINSCLSQQGAGWLNDKLTDVKVADAADQLAQKSYDTQRMILNSDGLSTSLSQPSQNREHLTQNTRTPGSNPVSFPTRNLRFCNGNLDSGSPLGFPLHEWH